MTLNGTTSNLPGSKNDPGGIGPGVTRGGNLMNDVFTSNDTRLVDVPEGGTIESGGING